MKPGLLLLTLSIGTAAVGYLEISHQAEREAWRVATSRLAARVDEAERRVTMKDQALAGLEQNRTDLAGASTKLADLESRILDKTAELALLETDRVVAQERAAEAVEDLKQQVRLLTAIEADMATLEQRRLRMHRHVETVERALQRAETGAAERQKRAEALDREIAELAIRRETLRSSLDAGERALAKQALATPAGRTEAEAPSAAAPPPIAPTTGQPAAEPEPSGPPPDAADDDRPAVAGKRARGLYQFGSLSADPDIPAAGTPGEPSSPADGPTEPDGSDRESPAAAWADDQYLLGLNLVSNAEQRSGTRELSEAVLAFKAVLGEWPRERDPMRWAIARNDLGYALALLGKRERSTDLLNESVVAARDALDQFKRDEAPLLWAAAHHHLGVSLGGLADLRDDLDLRRQAITAFETAIEVFKAAGAETEARKVEGRLREAYQRLPVVLPEALE